MNIEPDITAPTGAGSYPLEETAARINERLRLYLSPGQQRGLATGLLVGIGVAAVVIAWGVGSAVRKSR